MFPKTTTADLLKVPFHERRTLMVVDDLTAQQLVEHASASREEAMDIGEPQWVPPLAVRAALDPGVSSVALGRARELVGKAARAGVSPSATKGVLALGVLGLATVAVFVIGRDDTSEVVIVISASAAEGLTFDGGPVKLRHVYAAHPKQDGRYLPWETFSQTILNERTMEAESFLITCCGASRVETIVEHGDDLTAVASLSTIPGLGSAKWNAKLLKNTKDHRVIEAPGWSVPKPIEPSEWVWLDSEPLLQAIHHSRCVAGITKVDRDWKVKDDRSVDFKVPKVLNEKVNLNAVIKRHDTMAVTWKVLFPAV